MKTIFTSVLTFLLCLSAFSQMSSNFFSIDVKGIKQQIGLNKSKEIVISLPMPDGSYHTFRATPNQVLSPSLQAQYPDLHSFDMVDEFSSVITGKLTLGDNTVYAILETPRGMITIAPAAQEKGLYKSYFGNNDPEVQEEEKQPIECGQQAEAPNHENKGIGMNLQKSGGGFSRGATIRTYRAAIVTTNEFFAANGATQMSAMTVITNTINGWNIIYEKDLAVTFTIVLTKIYGDAVTDPDPFTPDTQMGASSRTVQAQNGLNANFNINDYDIGHVFHKHTNGDGWSGGGVAQLQSVCTSGKGGAWSGSFNNTSNGWIRLSAHEVGHQFGARHTFNGIGNSCDNNNIDKRNSYEIGSGTTIMSYQGICQANNNIPISGVADNYFHATSINEMVAFISTGSGMNCGTNAGANNIPVINTNPCNAGTVTIPKSTPFELTGSATDADNDVLTYCWEQFNEDDEVYGANSTTTQGKIGAAAGADAGAPLFRSFPPSNTATRIFPIIGNIINNIASDFEVLPTVARNMKFALTVRDGKGGVVCASRDVAVSANGPFTVTAPAMNASLAADGMTNHTITWSKGGFTGCNNVNIKLSIDGGQTYPITLATNVPYGANDPQSTTVTLPSTLVGTTNARIKVECADNSCATFFNISPSFTITSTCLAGVSNIFPTDLQTFNAGPANLGWSNTGNRSYSTVVTSVMASFTDSDLGPQSPVANAQGSSTCQSVSFSNYKHKIYNFKVDKTGDYTFTRSSGFTVITIFNNFTSYNASNACASGTFLGSSVYFNGMSYTGLSNVSLTLVAGVTYTLLVGRANNSSVDISFSGPSSVLLEGTDPGASYSYTYVLVSDADGLIKDVNPTADFGTSGTYTAGTYKVYGISYLTADAANPKVWVGQSIGAVNSTVCLRQSTNFKPLSFTATLPVELLAFEARALETQNRLTWITASEENNAGFEVQRSKDAIAWEALDFVKGYGNSLQERNYKYYDIQPLRGINYYRLKQVDNDGTFEYSNIVSVTTKAADDFAFTLYPNPTKEAFTLELTGNDEPFNLQLIDQLGRVVQEWNQLEGTNHTFDTSLLASGFYTVIARNEQHSFVQRLVKQ
jgi:hypothetical protein